MSSTCSVTDTESTAGENRIWFQVKKIIGRKVTKGNRISYKIQWDGFGSECDSWEPRKSLCETEAVKQLVEEYERNRGLSKRKRSGNPISKYEATKRRRAFQKKLKAAQFQEKRARTKASVLEEKKDLIGTQAAMSEAKKKMAAMDLFIKTLDFNRPRIRETCQNCFVLVANPEVHVKSDGSFCCIPCTPPRQVKEKICPPAPARKNLTFSDM